MLRLSTVLSTATFLLVASLGQAALTSSNKDAILNKHNELRAGIINGSCTAADMQTLTWDDALASAAQEYAEKCDSTQTDPRNRKQDWGENLYKQSWSSNGTLSDAVLSNIVQKWYKHRGPSAQVVWAKTNKIGCGVYSCGKEGAWYKHIVSCKYNPAGNIIGETPWLPGKPCAACSTCTTDGPYAGALCAVGDTINTCADALGSTQTEFTWNKVGYRDCAALISGYAIDVSKNPSISPSKFCDYDKKNRTDPLCSATCGVCKTPSNVGASFGGNCTLDSKLTSHGFIGHISSHMLLLSGAALTLTTLMGPA